MIKKIIQNFIRIVQKIVVTIFLIVIYIVGIGLTSIFVMFFNRRLLRKTFIGKNTFWNEAKDYEADINSSVRQS